MPITKPTTKPSTKPSTKRHLTSAALALAGALVLTACGGADDTASDAGSAMPMDRGASSAPSADAAATGNDADVAFLTGMKPHHEQAVEMSDIVLAANPPAPVAELARKVKRAQAPEIEQMDQMMADLGHMDGDHMAGDMADDMAEHGGMMSDADMAELMSATGTDAARMYLEAMIEHHRGAIEAAEAELADGKHEPARELARTIAQDQAAEISEMQALLADL